MKKLFTLLALSATLLWHNALQAQCIPANTRPVFGTTGIASGTATFTNVPTGNVVQINCPAANTQYFIDLCSTNPGTNVPDGTNDGHLSVLNQNSSSATVLAFFEDGCTNILGNGWGPPVGTWTAPAASTYFLYLTEWGANQCVADGVNNAYDFVITVTPPPSNDLAIDSAFMPSVYTTISLQQYNNGPLSVGARLRNVGSSTANNVTLNVRIRELISNTVVSTTTLNGPASLASGVTANVVGTPFAAPATPAVYEFRYICAMQQTDPNKSNDTFFRYVVLDPSLLTFDYTALFGDVDNALGFNNPIIMGQKYPITVATQVDTVFSAHFITPANFGQNVRAVIYNVSGTGLPTTLLAASSVHTFSAADTGGAVIDFAFSPNVNLTPGTYYVGIEQQGTTNMGLVQTLQNLINGNALFATSPFTTWNDIALAGFPGSFAIWVNTKLNCTLQASGTSSQPTCGQNNGSASLNISGANGTPSYLWSNGSTSTTISNVGPGTYIATVSAGGCIDTASVVLVNNGNAVNVSATPTSATCGSNNGSVAAIATGGNGNFAYIWSNGGNTATINNLSAGSYTVTVTSSVCTATASAFVGSTGGPSANASSTNVLCNGGSTGSANVSATGGTTPYTYIWSNGGNQQTISNVSAGTYTVTVTDAGSCLVTASVVVNEPVALSAAASPTAISCHNGTNGVVSASGNGGTGSYTYLWSNGATSASINNLNANTYTVTITDANSCTATASATLNNPTPVTLQASATNVSCNGGNNGSATAIANGGAGNYSFTWSNGGNSATVNNLPIGSYNVTVNDANGCSTTASVSITQPSALSAQASCEPTTLGQNNGLAVVTVNGGTSPYNFNWSSGATSDTAQNLQEGVVTVTVTDANNCTFTTNCEVQFVIGIDEASAGINQLGMYPNPASNYFALSVTFKESVNAIVTVTDMKGSVVTESRYNQTNIITESFDVSAFAKGVYTLQITTPTGIVSHKLTIQ